MSFNLRPVLGLASINGFLSRSLKTLAAATRALLKSETKANAYPIMPAPPITAFTTLKC